MKTATRLAFCGLLSLSLTAPAYADTCLQLNGGDFSGDIGFIRLKGKLPKAKGVIKPLVGRIAGFGTVHGSMIVDKNSGNSAELGLNFWLDGTLGVADIFLYGPEFTSGSGQGSYGSYDNTSFFEATVVSCDLEP